MTSTAVGCLSLPSRKRPTRGHISVRSGNPRPHSNAPSHDEKQEENPRGRYDDHLKRHAHIEKGDDCKHHDGPPDQSVRVSPRCAGPEPGESDTNSCHAKNNPGISPCPEETARGCDREAAKGPAMQLGEISRVEKMYFVGQESPRQDRKHRYNQGAGPGAQVSPTSTPVSASVSRSGFATKRPSAPE